MQVITPGHRYMAYNVEDKSTGQTIQFISKALKANSGDVVGGGVLTTVCDGTTNEELMSILIDRLQFLQSSLPCKENACAITHMEEALMWLEKRTRDRVSRNVEGMNLK